MLCGLPCRYYDWPSLVFIFVSERILTFCDSPCPARRSLCTNGPQRVAQVVNERHPCARCRCAESFHRPTSPVVQNSADELELPEATEPSASAILVCTTDVATDQLPEQQVATEGLFCGSCKAAFDAKRLRSDAELGFVCSACVRRFKRSSRRCGSCNVGDNPPVLADRFVQPPRLPRLIIAWHGCGSTRREWLR